MTDDPTTDGPTTDGENAPDGARDQDLDIEERELCPDGSCVGVIGADGRCKVCGRAGEGGARVAPASSPAPFGASDEAEAEGADDAAEQADDTGASDDGDRRLCPDGSCVGLIGPDGRCKVCGLPEDAAVK